MTTVGKRTHTASNQFTLLLDPNLGRPHRHLSPGLYISPCSVLSSLQPSCADQFVSTDINLNIWGGGSQISNCLHLIEL